MKRRSIATVAATQFGTSAMPPHVSILGNAFTLVDGAGERRPLDTRYMDVVFIDINEHMTRIFFKPPDEKGMLAYDPSDQSPPMCFSDNGVAPSSRAMEPQAKTCTQDRTGTHGCRWSVWGSAISKRDGKTKIPACQNGIKTAVLLVNCKNPGPNAQVSLLNNLVFTFRIPGGSIEAYRAYGKQVSDFGPIDLPFTQEGENHDLPLMVTRVTFEDGQVGQLKFQPIAYIDETINNFIEQVPDQAADEAVGRNDTPIVALEQKPTAQMPATVDTSARTQVLSPPAEPKKPGRPRKQPEAAPFLPPSTGQALPPDGSIPPFLQRAASNPKQEEKPKAPFGIQNEAPPPNADLNNLLQQTFGLPTKSRKSDDGLPF